MLAASGMLAGPAAAHTLTFGYFAYAQAVRCMLPTEGRTATSSFEPQQLGGLERVCPSQELGLFDAQDDGQEHDRDSGVAPQDG